MQGLRHSGCDRENRDKHKFGYHLCNIKCYLLIFAVILHGFCRVWIWRLLRKCTLSGQ
ncbi:hypothetical protein ECTW07793_3209 [Escherichia coli TW07793]|nr:hypothetical protein ECTW07793_3209 [Escherichia coli TW07793]